MNLLIVCSGNRNNINAFIAEQAQTIHLLDQTSIHYYFIKGKGITGYLQNVKGLIKCIKTNKIDIIHAHYGLSGLLSVLQKKVPIIITFHGSDVNQKKIRGLSRLASVFAHHNIIVEKSFAEKIKLKRNYTVLPCGVSLNTFFPIDKYEARKELGFKEDERLILFSSAFTNPVKNYPLAKESVDKVPASTLIELAGCSREKVNLLMNAADMLLLTSFSEGSPQVVKEALACNLPVVATPVGDVEELLRNVSNTFIVPYDSNKIAHAINKILSDGKRSNGRHKMKDYDNREVAKKLVHIYRSVLNKHHA
jgi:teichuronic acid biosynthesis glycosyltransferase TuaC